MTRLRYNGLSATLGGSGLTSSATSVTFTAALTHSGGQSVPTITGSDYIPLSILDSAGRLSEVVYLTTYTSGGSTGTITRAQEGTNGVAHASGDKVAHGPTVSDLGFTAGAWTDLPLASGIVSTEASFGHRPQYRLVGDTVELRGIAKKSSGVFVSGSATLLTTLPAGYRPLATPGSAADSNPAQILLIFPAITDNAASRAQIQVTPSGAVSMVAGITENSSWASLDGITFSTI